MEANRFSSCSHLQCINLLLRACPRITHLSLTGVQEFNIDDLKLFCKKPPPGMMHGMLTITDWTEFTPHQAQAFCVFSGQQVNILRQYLSGDLSMVWELRRLQENRLARDAARRTMAMQQFDMLDDATSLPTGYDRLQAVDEFDDANEGVSSLPYDQIGGVADLSLGEGVQGDAQ
jgi:hypothetical protein